jgi:hydrogenase expression/formation protein HypC
MNKIDEEDALASLMMYKEILGALDEEGLKKTILEDDDCENRT